MGDPAIELRGLAKTFGQGKNEVQAVRRIDIEVGVGQVFGFLGPNGAGKSTTIRMIMDLIRPTAGSVRIFGHTVGGKTKALARVGALVEGAVFYDHLSGRRNLEVLARTQGKYARADIDELLERLGMTGRAERTVQGYSMGMKQRLGVAAALLSRPELVILDEPTNGLDPAGIREMRRFIRDLVDRDGLTVFLSSHLLTEVEQICDRVAILQGGKVVHEDDVATLLNQSTSLHLRVAQPGRAAEVLGETWPVHRDGDVLTLDVASDAAPEVVRRLVAASIDVFEVKSERRSLEDFFLDVTGHRPEEERSGGET